MTRILLRVKWMGLVLVLLVVMGVFWTVCHKSLHTKPYDVGIVTWVGYGPLFIAQEKGFFADEGLQVQIRIMDGPGEREAAYQSGELEFFPNTPDAFAIFASQGGAGKMVMPMDESSGADGLVANKNVTSVADLKGRKVGFQSGITSHFFLLYLLNEAGLEGSDVVQQNLGAGDAGAAFVAGKLDAAVTWEPWLTKARELPSGHVLATSKDTPGLLADVLLVKDEVLSNNRDDVLAFMRAWFRAVDFMESNENEAANIVANAFKLDEGEVREMLATDHFFTRAESRQYFGTKAHPGKVFEVFRLASVLYKENGVIDTIPDVNSFVDTSLIEEMN